MLKMDVLENHHDDAQAASDSFYIKKSGNAYSEEVIQSLRWEIVLYPGVNVYIKL